MVPSAATPRPVLLIDNVDSFTYNVADLLHRVLGRAPVVWRHDHAAAEEDLLGFAAIVVGPGPGRPQVAADMGLSDLALRQTRVPVLGVCLGHQGQAHLAGERVVQMAVPRHGIVSPVEHDGTGIFEGVPSPLQVVRYHSLEAAAPFVSGLRVTARATDDGSVMGLADPDAPRWGVQFHPESVLSEHGERIVGNFFRLAGVDVEARPQDSGPVAVGDALTPHAHASAGRALSLRVCRLHQAGEAGRHVDVWALHEQLVGGSPSSVWLDASDGSGWSLVVDGTGPLSREIVHRVGGAVPLLDRLDEVLDGWTVVDGPVGADGEEVTDLPFTWRPGVVGWFGYELKAETGGSAAHRSPWPDAWLLLVDRGVVVDHGTGEVWAVWLEDDDIATAQRAWAAQAGRAVETAGTRPTASAPGPEAAGRRPVAVPRDTETAYLEKVRAAQDEIARGESYEICLTTTWATRGAGLDEAALYRTMREVSPVPHGCWIRTPAVSVLGCSPERFVSVDGSGHVEARPIKGTRPRGATPEEDAALAADLLAAQKDRAENLMIVDLLRNDLHRVCRAGSVHVPEIFAVETYATVHQLVSTVRGRLADGMGPTDVLRACFPGGSMTGAPKVRTMEILDRLEGAPRGIYSGAVGWIGVGGSMDTSIVIRTATWQADGRGRRHGGDITFGVGGAVTALSDPAEEYAETLTKARSILRAIEVAAGGEPSGATG